MEGLDRGSAECTTQGPHYGADADDRDGVDVQYLPPVQRYSCGFKRLLEVMHLPAVEIRVIYELTVIQGVNTPRRQRQDRHSEHDDPQCGYVLTTNVMFPFAVVPRSGSTHCERHRLFSLDSDNVAADDVPDGYKAGDGYEVNIQYLRPVQRNGGRLEGLL